MEREQRTNLEWFCAEARCEIEGIDDEKIFDKVLFEMRRLSDDDLIREADWLDDMLGK